MQHHSNTNLIKHYKVFKDLPQVRRVVLSQGWLKVQGRTSPNLTLSRLKRFWIKTVDRRKLT
jgi:hypothetical protein